MEQKVISIRPFIGAKDFERSRNFYRELGFQEVELSDQLSLFKKDQTGFYLQNAYVQDWIDNTMVFLEVDDIDLYWKELSALNLVNRYQGVKLTPIHDYEWGRECFLHDPSGVLWHFGQFKAPKA